MRTTRSIRAVWVKISMTFGLAVLFATPSQISNAQVAPTTSAVITGSVVDPSGEPVTNATISLTGPRNARTASDSHGLFVFVGIPFGTYTLTASDSNLGTANRSGLIVQGDINVAIQYTPKTNSLKTIANVSSKANAGFNVTPASITQVSPTVNALQGKTSWRTILEQIPGIAQAGLGTGNYAEGSVPDGPLVPMKLSINGALPYETAVLLDGMPLIGRNIGNAGGGGPDAGSGTDLAVYPLNAFSTADVVRGPGAASPSIVDSIGGSFVLRSPGAVTHDELELSTSNDPYGGIVQNDVIAKRFDKLSVVATYGLNDSPGPVHSSGIPSSLFSSPLAVDGNAFAPYAPPCNPPSCQFGLLLNPAFSAQSTGVGGFYGYVQGLMVCCAPQSTGWTQHSLSLAARFDFSNRLAAEVFYAGQSSNMFSVPFENDTVSFVPPSGYSGAFKAGDHLVSGLGGSLGGFPANQGSNILEEKVLATLGSGNLQFSALQNRTYDSLSYSFPATAVLNLFGGGTENGSPVVFNGESHTVSFIPLTFDESDQTINRDLMARYETPLSPYSHVGVSFVRSYYNTPSLENVNLGAPVNFFFSTRIPSGVSQTTDEYRLFAGGNPSNRTSLDVSLYVASARYHVQDPTVLTGNSYVDKVFSYSAPRLGFVWRPSTPLSVRVALGGGFAEAPINDLIGSNGAPECSSGSLCTVTLTNIGLQPEKSFGFDLGADLRLTDRSIVSVDLYRSNLYGQIFQNTFADGTFNGLPLYATRFGNLGESRYNGLLLDFRSNTPKGIFWSASGGLTRGFVVSLPGGFYDTATWKQCTNLTVVPNINFNGSFAASIPYSQAIGRLGYRWSPDHFIGLVGTYYGNNNTYFRPAFLELDAQAGWSVGKIASLLLTFRNVTGVYAGDVQNFSLSTMTGAPTIKGPPFALYGEQYGPRAIVVTTNFHI